MKHIRTTAVLLLSVGLGAVATMPAHAADVCTDSVCVWDGSGLTGAIAGFTTADNNFSNNRFQGSTTSVNDHITSIENHNGSSARFYTNSYWRGDTQDVPGGYWVNARYNNAYSSFRYLI